MNDIQEYLRQDVNSIENGDLVFHRLTGNKGIVKVKSNDHFGVYWYGGNENEILHKNILHNFWTHKNLLLKDVQDRNDRSENI